jgi:hypothetical protein
MPMVSASALMSAPRLLNHVTEVASEFIFRQ